MADDAQTQPQTLTNEEVGEQVANLKRRAGMEWHLTGNFYPPMPVVLVDVALEAIDIANSYDAQYGVDSNKIMEQELSLPDGMTVDGKSTIPVYEVIDWLRLESMVYDVLDCDDDDDENADVFEDDDGALRMEAEIPYPFDE